MMYGYGNGIGGWGYVLMAIGMILFWGAVIYGIGAGPLHPPGRPEGTASRRTAAT